MQITPYLFAAGNAAEILAFYRDAIGGELEIIPYQGSPAAAGMPPDWADKVLWGALHSPFGDIAVMDAPPGRAGSPGDNFAVEIKASDVDRVTEIYGRLSAGGEILMALEETFWSRKFGMFVDRFGTRWMITAGPA